MDRNRMFLGEMLADVGIISAEQLKKAHDLWKSTGDKIGDILLREGFVTQDDINSVLQLQLGIPFIELDKYDVDPESCLVIQESLAKRHVLIPIKLKDGILTVAMSDPLNFFAMEDVRIASGYEVQPVIAGADDILKAMKRYYGAQDTMIAVREFIGEKKAGEKETQEKGALAAGDLENAPTVRLVRNILEQAVRSRASDIHIEPFENTVRIRFRIDGHLKDAMQIDKGVASAVSARIDPGRHGHRRKEAAPGRQG